jgi:hypothetical protein
LTVSMLICCVSWRRVCECVARCSNGGNQNITVPIVSTDNVQHSTLQCHCNRAIGGTHRTAKAQRSHRNAGRSRLDLELECFALGVPLGRLRRPVSLQHHRRARREAQTRCAASTAISATHNGHKPKSERHNDLQLRSITVSMSTPSTKLAPRATASVRSCCSALHTHAHTPRRQVPMRGH